MNQILEWLSAGDLRSDGLANEVAEFVLQHPHVCGDLLAGLDRPEDVIRGHAADALEKVSRSRPDLLIDHLPKLIAAAAADDVPMVKMHLAMILGHLAMYEHHIDQITCALLELLAEKSVFARSWAIGSLTIIGRLYPWKQDQIVKRLTPLEMDSSIAIRTRVRTALNLLTHEGAKFPKGWIKSESLRHLGG